VGVFWFYYESLSMFLCVLAGTASLWALCAHQVQQTGRVGADTL